MNEIDTEFQGTELSVCCFEQDGVLLDPGPESCSRTVQAKLDALGIEPHALLLTHIHLDHAGGAGRLAERHPDLVVYVHERGARHIEDPSKLVASATRIYGDDMERLWGTIMPVPRERLHVLEGDGGELFDGAWRWAYTPGHAQHHVVYQHTDTGVVFAGDVAGVRIGGGPVQPPTPPPDIDVEVWKQSIELVRSWSPTALAVTHYGSYTDVDQQLDELSARLDRWAGWAREGDPEKFEQQVIDDVLQGTEDEDERAAYAKANPPATLYAGLARYWKKRDEA